MDRLTSMAAFVRVAEKGSFAAASGELGMSTTMVANHVRALEQQLGARLRAVPQGTLRVSAPVTWGTHRLVAVVAQYMARYPGMRVATWA